MYLVREYYEYGYVDMKGNTIWSLLGIKKFDTLEDALNFTKRKRQNGIFHYGAVYKRNGNKWELVTDERERVGELLEEEA